MSECSHTTDPTFVSFISILVEERERRRNEGTVDPADAALHSIGGLERDSNGDSRNQNLLPHPTFISDALLGRR